MNSIMVTLLVFNQVIAGSNPASSITESDLMRTQIRTLCHLGSIFLTDSYIFANVWVCQMRYNSSDLQQIELL
jgi:hypothetical protein